MARMSNGGSGTEAADRAFQPCLEMMLFRRMGPELEPISPLVLMSLRCFKPFCAIPWGLSTHPLCMMRYADEDAMHAKFYPYPAGEEASAMRRHTIICVQKPDNLFCGQNRISAGLASDTM